uniref:DEP domain-containing protein n=1 Tax=Leptobrachium leishanense TaxID=445787 RepID=A0A8C5Q9U7_9ANUR
GVAPHWSASPATEQEHRMLFFFFPLCRYRLHLVKIIKDRCKNVSTYPCTFAAKEVLDWLVERKEAPDRETAMKIMQRFMEYNVIHHVCDHHTVFKDAMALYRFREDDGTNFMSLPSIRMIQQDDAMLKHKESDSEKYSRIFRGSELVDWLVRNREVVSRLDGEVLGCAMVQYGILQHVSRLYNFSDSNKPYQFAINFRRKRKIMEILEVDTMPLKPDSESSPFCLRKLGDTDLPHGGFFCGEIVGRKWYKMSAVKLLHTGKLCQFKDFGRPRGIFAKTITLSFLANIHHAILTRFVSVEELLEPGAPFLQKLLTILSDAVGWGFVIRGTGPCHVQAVDPGGPAAAAGMQVRQFLRTVNGMCCLRLDYQTINRLIVAGPKRLVLEVIHLDCARVQEH